MSDSSFAGDRAIAAKAYARSDSLVSTDWLAAHLDDPSVRIIESDEDVLLYDIGQERALDQCDRATSPQDRTACRKANSESYEDYEKRRQAAKEGRAP